MMDTSSNNELSKETYSTLGAECPYCNYLNTADDSDYALYDETLSTYECDECKKKFSVRVFADFAWECTTFKP